MRLEFRLRSKDKISSLRSTDNLVRATFLNHYALNNDERANLHGFHLRTSSAACADAWRSPSSLRSSDGPLLWFMNVTLAALSLQRARIGHRRLSNGFRAFQSFRLAD